MSKLFANYNRLDVAFDHGHGCTLYDVKGRTYLDFLSGIAVTSLGHAHPRLVEALTDQVSKLLHVSNLYKIPEQERAAEKLTEVCGFDAAFFCNSGAEANECLIKIARRFAHKNDLPTTITVAHNSFHGRTLATLSATGNPKYQENFQPLVPGFRFVDFNDLDAALEALQESCAILLEPVQGEGGVIPAQKSYLTALEKACAEQGKLFLLDEVQTGIGRTGHWLAAQHYGVKADAVALAKGLGGGVPVGAVLARQDLAELLPPGAHGTTFGGNLLASRAVLTVLEVMESEGLLEKARSRGELLRRRLRGMTGVKSVRGLGLLLAVELESGLDTQASAVATHCFEEGLLVNAVRPNAIRLAPPLVVKESEIEAAATILEKAICRLTTSAAGAS